MRVGSLSGAWLLPVLTDRGRVAAAFPVFQALQQLGPALDAPALAVAALPVSSTALRKSRAADGTRPVAASMTWPWVSQRWTRPYRPSAG